MPIDSLQPREDNPRNASQARIDELAVLLVDDPDFMQARPVIADPQGRIIAGEQRWRAARQLGRKRIHAVHLDGDARLQAERMVRDNAHVGEWDAAALASLIATHDVDTTHVGMTRAETDALLAAVPRARRQADPDDSPPLPPKPRSALGDVFNLGRHRLLCGDCTDRDEVAAFLDDELQDMVFTDPPYAVAVSKAGGKAIHGDLTTAAISVFMQVLLQHVKPGGAVYTCCGSANISLAQKLYEVNLGQLPQFIVWDKGHFILRHHGYHSQFEMIAYGWTPGGGRREAHWYSDRKQTDVWQITRDSDGTHPTMKPVELVERAIQHSSPSGGVVFDPFGGSGSTLIAAERSGRACRMIEIDPRYCDVIRDRYEAFTAS